jgi:putative oxidoreductase
LGLFFLLNGVKHFYNTQVLKEYADKKGLLAPKLMIILSGLLLISGGLSLMTGYLIIPGIVGLSFFLVFASFSIHKFWQESKREIFLLEAMNFVKNFAIMFELIYIGTTLE